MDWLKVGTKFRFQGLQGQQPSIYMQIVWVLKEIGLNGELIFSTHYQDETQFSFEKVGLHDFIEAFNRGFWTLW